MLSLPFKFTKFIVWSVAFALLAQPVALAQDAAGQTRPRRVQQETPPVSPIQPTNTDIAVTRLDAEPSIRIGLSTGARSVTISTNGQSLTVIRTQPGETTAPAALAVSRVRIEPRLLTPLPAPRTDENNLYRVEVAAATSESQAASVARDVKELTGEAPEVLRDATTATWRVRVGVPAPRAEAEELRTRLEEAGIASVSLVSTGGAQHSTGTAQQDSNQSARARQSSNATATARRAPNSSTP
ncbi:MAG TPA: SPOR domain-containing protein, partial [Pyrinomonadaceae bacterium]